MFCSLCPLPINIDKIHMDFADDLRREQGALTRRNGEDITADCEFQKGESTEGKMQPFPEMYAIWYITGS